MKIKDISIKNFLSIQDAYIDFSEYTDLTVIKGKNLDTGGSNGSGKSSLIDAIYFGLTGKTLRKSVESSLVNFKAQKGLSVDLNLRLDDGRTLLISRNKRPTKMRLVLDGEDITTKHSRDSQETVDELLGTNHKVLAASMFFGQSNNINFLDCTPHVKRDIIRNFLNLEDLFVMRERIKEYKSEYSNRIKVADQLILQCRRDIEQLTNKLESIDTSIDVDLDSLSKEWEVYYRLSDKWNKTNKKREAVNSSVAFYKNKLKNKDPRCHSCGRSISLEKFEKELVVLESDLLALDKTLNELPTAKIPKYSEEYVRLSQGNSAVLRELISDKEERVEELEQKKSEAYTGGQVMRFWETAFSEKGIIKYIIRNVLQYFNNRIAFYLSYLTDPNFSLEFDEELSEYIKVGDNEVYYISLSGGEKRKINLAVMMALKDLLLLTDTNHSNLLFFDEIADNIDPQGIDGLFALLSEMKKDKQVFIITHNPLLQEQLEDVETLTITKRNGISTVV